MKNSIKVKLTLEDGTIYHGRSFGSAVAAAGEVALLEIHGIGEAKLRRYGEALLRLVAGTGDPATTPAAATHGRAAIEEETEPSEAEGADGQCEEPSYVFDGDGYAPLEDLPRLPPPRTPAPPVPERSDAAPEIHPSYYWTWRLLKAGFSLDECAAVRRLDRGVILDHALEAVENGYPVRPESCLGPGLLAALESVAAGADILQIQPIMAKLPAGTRQEEVLLFLKCRHA